MAGFSQAQQMEISGAIEGAIGRAGLNPTQEASVRTMVEAQISQLTDRVKETITQASQEVLNFEIDRNRQKIY